MRANTFGFESIRMSHTLTGCIPKRSRISMANRMVCYSWLSIFLYSVLGWNEPIALAEGLPPAALEKVRNATVFLRVEGFRGSSRSIRCDHSRDRHRLFDSCRCGRGRSQRTNPTDLDGTCFDFRKLLSCPCQNSNDRSNTSHQVSRTLLLERRSSI